MPRYASCTTVEATTSDGGPSATRGAVVQHHHPVGEASHDVHLVFARRIVLSPCRRIASMRSRITGTSSTLIPAVGSSNMKTGGLEREQDGDLQLALVAVVQRRGGGGGAGGELDRGRESPRRVNKIGGATPPCRAYGTRSPRAACTARRTFSSTVQVGEKLGQLEGPAHAAPHPRRCRQPRDPFAAQQDIAGGGPELAGDQVEIRRLAGSRWGPTIAVSVPAVERARKRGPPRPVRRNGTSVQPFLEPERHRSPAWCSPECPCLRCRIHGVSTGHRPGTIRRAWSGGTRTSIAAPGGPACGTARGPSDCRMPCPSMAAISASRCRWSLLVFSRAAASPSAVTMPLGDEEVGRLAGALRVLGNQASRSGVLRNLVVVVGGALHPFERGHGLSKISAPERQVAAGGRRWTPSRSGFMGGGVCHRDRRRPTSRTAPCGPARTQRVQDALHRCGEVGGGGGSILFMARCARRSASAPP